MNISFKSSIKPNTKNKHTAIFIYIQMRRLEWEAARIDEFFYTKIDYLERSTIDWWNREILAGQSN